ncbi:MAG: STAS domain-containing protein [Syntrophales bacterium]|nr:STAS domain-containing protein [Syntrophales bacterium]
MCVIEPRVADQKTLVLNIRGTLNATCKKEISAAFEKGTGKSQNILLNLSDLRHMDPGGAGLLVICASGAAQKDLAVAACGLTDPFRDLFRLTRLDEAMVLFDSEKEALQSPVPWGKNARSAGPPAGDHGSPVPGWAKYVERLSVRDIPKEVMNINVNGRRMTSPVKGFGRLWEKKYRLRLKTTSLEPREIVSIWRAEFPDFWPKGNYIFTSGHAAICPGTSAVLNLTLPGGLVMATGLMVIYADETSFSFTTIQGHILSGWITFGSFQEESAVIIQVNPIFRASDPLMELGMRFGAARQEDQFWHATLGNLARRLGVQGEISQQDVLIDPHIQWNEFKNLWYNPAIRSSLYMPVYMLKRMLQSG